MALSLRVFTTILLGAVSMPGVCRRRARTSRRCPTILNSCEVHGTPVKKTPPSPMTISRYWRRSRPPTQRKLPRRRQPRACNEGISRSSAESGGEEGGNCGAGTADQREATEDSTSDAHVVLDEQAFLKDPSGQSEEEEARAKRRFEQEELLQEGKEVARLRARLEQIAPPGARKQPRPKAWRQIRTRPSAGKTALKRRQLRMAALRVVRGKEPSLPRQEEGSLGFATRRAKLRREEGNRVAPLGMTAMRMAGRGASQVIVRTWAQESCAPTTARERREDGEEDAATTIQIDRCAGLAPAGHWSSRRTPATPRSTNPRPSLWVHRIRKGALS